MHLPFFDAALKKGAHDDGAYSKQEGENVMGFLKEALEIKQEIVCDRRYLHSCAEVGFDLKDTAAYVKKMLRDMGVAAEECGKCGVVGVIGEGEKTFLLRADMDALPIREEAAEEFACAGGCMHACGHDMHTAMLLGAARMLKKHEKELNGCVKLMFQPAEEPLEGAQDMIDHGVLRDPSPEAGAMVHVMTGVPIPTGTVIVSAPGVSAPAANMFEIYVQGRGGHGASPEGCIDPVNAAAHIILALQSIKAREVAAQSGAMLTIGAVNGGDAPNVIADHVVLRGSLRAYSEEECAFLRRRTAEIADLTARTFGATAEFTVTGGTKTLKNDVNMVNLAKAALPEILGQDRVLEAEKMGGARSSGSEDFACVSHEIPTVMLALAAGHPNDGYTHGLHHPMTRFDENALPYGAAALAGLAARYLSREKK